MINILLVDDDPGILDMCRLVLVQNGFSVFTAKNGEEALEKFKVCDFAVAVVNILIPGVGEFNLLKVLKNTHPELILLTLTGEFGRESALKSLENGAYDYIVKPFGTEVFLNTVKKAVEYSKLSKRTSIFREINLLYPTYKRLQKKGGEISVILGAILSKIVKTFDGDSGSIFLFSEQIQTLKLISFVGSSLTPDLEIKLGERIIGWVALKQTPLIINGAATKLSQFSNIKAQRNTSSSLIVPAMKGTQLMGVICLSRKANSKKGDFTEEDLKGMMYFADHTAFMVKLNKIS